MPCESCRVEFTVFRRKRSCFDCRRYYCNNCLTATTARRCQRCAIFAQRPLLRTDLLKLKPKDLIFFLQSKHISTEGCLEKEELVGLVLTHVAQADRDAGRPPHNSPGRGQANPMDSLKQTCQNFFTNLSDNISDSFASFDTKSSAKSTTNNSRANSRHASQDNASIPFQPPSSSPPTSITDQPRVSTREIPTYASSGHVPSPSRSGVRHNSTEFAHVHVSPSSTSSTHTTTTSPTATEDRRPTTLAGVGLAAQLRNEQRSCDSECECSDDEIIQTFSERTSLKNSERQSTVEADAATAGADAGAALTPNNGTTASTAATINTSPGYSKPGSLSSKVDACGADSSQSSFEELGAIGGISDESKTATDTNSSNLDQWQILDPAAPSSSQVQQSLATPTSAGVEGATATEEILEVTLRNEPGEMPNIEQRTVTVPQQLPQSPQLPQPAQRVKKVTRRRSDGYLNRRHHSSDDESPVAANGLALSTLSEQPEPEPASSSGSCRRCGKNKTNIRKHVEKMRRHLENSQMSEEDIKRELQEFLTYLEQRTKSLDCSEAGSHVVSPLSVGDAGSIAAGGGGSGGMPITPTIEFSPTQDDDHHWGDDEGIHVYGAPMGFEPANGIDTSRFINLEDYEDLKDLENLTVKQLKEILMLHRVDYKGCCEKQELLDRVTRLWKTMRTAPAVEKLPTDELCKICMDAPIECVFLECGHMATCTNCGKVLPECPICRQYIVRVVRFFRA